MTIDLFSIANTQIFACRGNELHTHARARAAVMFKGKRNVKAVKWKRADSVFSFQTEVSSLFSPLHCHFVGVYAFVCMCVSVIKLIPGEKAIIAAEARHLS